MAAAVEKIDGKSYAEPDEEADPSLQRQTEHEREAHDHSKNGEERYQRHPKGSRPSRILSPKDNYSQTNEDERKQSSDICEVGK